MSLDNKLGDARTVLTTAGGGTIGYLVTMGNPLAVALGLAGGYILDRTFAKAYRK